MIEKINQEDILFWLKAGMDLQEDKRFLLTVISDLRKQNEELLKFRTHADNEYDKLREKYNLLKARVMTACQADVVCPPKESVESEAIGAVFADSGPNIFPIAIN